MTTLVDKLLKKALSTSSEDEAISSLRLARKRHVAGETVSINNDNDAANKLQDLVDKLDRTLDQQDAEIESLKAQLKGYESLFNYTNTLANKLSGWLIASGILNVVLLIVIVIMA